MADPAVAASAGRKAYLNVVLPLFLVSIIAYVDRRGYDRLVEAKLSASSLRV